MAYLLKASAIIVIFYLCYQVFLRKETFFQANRWFLLSGLFFAVGLPLFVIPIYVETVAFDISGYQQFPTETITNTIPQSPIERSFDLMQLLYWVYGLGVILSVTKLLINLFSLNTVFKSAELVKSEQFRIYNTDKNVAPFSFFKGIVFNPAQFNGKDLEYVINHEKVHARQYHSADTILAHFACTLFWFNPFAWLYDKAIQQNLEFIADAQTQHFCTSSKSYQKLLLRTSVNYRQLAMTNTFYSSTNHLNIFGKRFSITIGRGLIKKRIIMLQQSRSETINLIKLAVAIPFLIGFMMSFNTETVYVASVAKMEEPQLHSIQEKDSLKVVFDKDMTDADLAGIKKDLFAEGILLELNRLKRNSKNEIIAIKIIFTVKGHTLTRNLSATDPIEPFYFLQIEDEFEVGNLVPDKKPLGGASAKIPKANRSYNVSKAKKRDTTLAKKHISFVEIDTSSFSVRNYISGQIKGDSAKTTINASEYDTSFSSFPSNETPHVIVDGETSSLNVLKLLNPKSIAFMEVVKGQSAILSYGEKAKHGAIIITTKNYLVRVESKLKDDITVKKNNEGEFIVSGKDSFVVYIIDGKQVSKSELEKLDKDKIKSIDVIRGADAVEKFGSKASSGATIIITKSDEVASVIGQSRAKSKTALNLGTKGEHQNAIQKDDKQFIIDKASTDDFLKRQKAAMKVIGIEVKYSRVRRNRAGMITGIKISIDDGQGKASSASWKSSSDTIPDIVIGKSNDGSLILRSLE